MEIAQLFEKLIPYLSPISILLVIALIYQTKCINQRDDYIINRERDRDNTIKEKDKCIMDLHDEIVTGFKTLERLTTLIESLINRGGK